MKYLKKFDAFGSCWQKSGSTTYSLIIPDVDPEIWMKDNVKYFLRRYIKGGIKGKNYISIKYDYNEKFPIYFILTIKEFIKNEDEEDIEDFDNDQEYFDCIDYNVVINDIIIFILNRNINIVTEEGKKKFAEFQRFIVDMKSNIYKYIPDFDEIVKDLLVRVSASKYNL